MPGHLQDITVRSLMDVEGKCWDRDLLNDICNTRDIELITRIPIPVQERDDSWFWLSDNKGQFSVRSCYRWLQGDTVSEFTSFWKRFWSLRMPGKVLNFMWRVCKGCLPTAQALASKCVNISVTCPWCHGGAETDRHVLFDCDFAKTVWRTTGLYSFLYVTEQDRAFDVIKRVFDGCSRKQCVLLGMFCWSIWNRINKWVWERANGSVFGVKAAALNLLQD